MSRRALRIVSWNIQWGRGIDGRVDLTRTARVARAFDADVLCLQEVAVNHPGLPGGGAGDQVAILARLFPGYAAIYSAGSDLSDGLCGRRQFGELILSRLPIFQVFRHLLPWPADPAVPSMQRTAVEAVIEASFLPGGALRVLTTHLEYYSALQRSAQVEALLDICANGYRHAVAPRSTAETDPPFAVLPRGEGVVLCGDFNFSPRAVEYPRMQDSVADGVPRLVDVWPCVHGGSSHAPTAGVHAATFTGGPECFDFFFVSENLRPMIAGIEVDQSTNASDHQPVILDLLMSCGN